MDKEEAGEWSIKDIREFFGMPEEDTKGMRKCMSCKKSFESKAVRTLKICNKCKVNGGEAY